MSIGIRIDDVMSVYYETLRHNIIHDGEHLEVHCNLNPDKHVAIRDQELVLQMIASEHWTVYEAIGLVLGLIDRKELQDA